MSVNAIHKPQLCSNLSVNPCPGSNPSRSCFHPFASLLLRGHPLGCVRFRSLPVKKLWTLNQSNRAVHRRTSRPRAMFTGIVEEMGKVAKVGPVDGGGFEMIIESSVVLKDLKLGDSISTDGTCLTVTRFDSNSFTVGVSPETLRRTSLGEASTGSTVNLERALQPVSRMGGHFVQGHVDGTGTIISTEREGDSLWVRIKTSPQLLRYIVPKGFIAVDGASLTVVDVHDDECTFTFMLVAYTQQKVGIALKMVGSKVNVEVDVLGKYVERLLEGYKV